jgi:hypothetical protein
VHINAILVLVGSVTAIIGLGFVMTGRRVNLELEVGKRRRAAILVVLGIAADVVGLLGAGVGVLGWISKSTNAETTIAAPRSTDRLGTPTTAVAFVDLVLPIVNTKVPWAGTVVSGAVLGDLGRSPLWLFTWSDGKWYLNQRIEIEPDQSFSLHTGQVGETQDAGKNFTLGIFETNSEQSRVIKSAPRDSNGDITFDQPPGKMMASRKIVRR